MASLSLSRARESRGRAVSLVIWTLLALPLMIDLWIGYFRHPGDEFLRQWMNVDLGLWAVRIFLISLAISPVARLLAQPGIVRHRRMISLFAFAYVLVHGLDYIFYAHAWAFTLRVWERRIYLQLGLAAGVLMVPLAVTSIISLRRKMGPRRWKALHVSIYGIALLTAAHIYLWEDLSDVEQTTYCVLLAGLLLLRLPQVMPAVLRLRWTRETALSETAGASENTGLAS